MHLFINGEQRQTGCSTLSELLDELQLLDKRIAVEFNGNICPRSHWSKQALAASDTIEIVHAIGGG